MSIHSPLVVAITNVVRRNRWPRRGHLPKSAAETTPTENKYGMSPYDDDDAQHAVKRDN